jgi:hypothetical protein
MKTLVAGWFSFPDMGATAGDMLTRDLVCRWLDAAGRPYDLAVAPPFLGGVNWSTANPDHYTDVVFVCGPFGNGWPIPEFLTRFAGRRMVGVNLSMLEAIDVWNPFALLFERDSPATAHPDLAFLSPATTVPVVGVVLVHPQLEYATAAHDRANAAVERLAASRPMAVVRIDTRLDANATGLRTANEVESLIARMDVVITTRLHGLVLALKNGVPVVAVDPVEGGAKVRRQADAIGWPVCFPVEAADDGDLSAGLDFCLTEPARAHARAVADRSRDQLLNVRRRFIEAMTWAERAK